MNNLFQHPYTKVVFIERDLRVSRATAIRYLEALTKGKILHNNKLGRENYYINTDLVKIII
ncbi:hypothetical protein MNBD_GAMMA22-895 [hydrothermal vent metagenome]|uniref:Adenylyltransferase SoFic-like C-terminal domain-containing protein n=1 Tax=hydrothermal vent metagenome TaxID=652676 RepID=A0A3B1A4X3_9ZZZZ